jgi:hypothetical protein
MLYLGSLPVAWIPPEDHHGHVSREKGRFWISESSRHLAIHDNWDYNVIEIIELPSHTYQVIHNGLGKMSSKERIPYSSPSIHSEASILQRENTIYRSAMLQRLISGPTSHSSESSMHLSNPAPFPPLQNNQIFITIYTGFDSSSS